MKRTTRRLWTRKVEDQNLRILGESLKDIKYKIDKFKRI